MAAEREVIEAVPAAVPAGAAPEVAAGPVVHDKHGPL